MDDTPPPDDRPRSDAAPPDAGSPDAAPPVTGPRRWVYLAGGWGFLALGALGIFLPVLPTTPFVLVAAWLFSRSSERLHRRLLEHRTFGRVVREWEAHGVIRLRAKLLATAVIVPLVGWMLLGSDAPGWTRWATVVLVAWGLAFVWSRPSEPAEGNGRVG